jgi:hypothetical protein
MSGIVKNSLRSGGIKGGGSDLSREIHPIAAPFHETAGAPQLRQSITYENPTIPGLATRYFWDMPCTICIAHGGQNREIHRVLKFFFRKIIPSGIFSSDPQGSPQPDGEAGDYSNKDMRDE